MRTCVSPELIVTGQSIKLKHPPPLYSATHCTRTETPAQQTMISRKTIIHEMPRKSETSEFFDCLMNTAKNHTAKIKNINSLGTLVVFSSMRHRTYTYTLSTRSSFGILTSLRLGNLILEPAWRLDAFSAYPIRAQLPDSAVDTTIGSPEARHSRSSRTRECIPQISCAHSG